MAASTVATVINALASSNEKLDRLEELKVLLSAVPPQELRTIVPNVSILPVFECLNTNDKDQQEICCSVLERLLSALSSSLILENLHQEFVNRLQDGTDPVQTLCMSQLLRVSEESPELLIQCGDLLVAVAAQLAHHTQAIAQLATSIFVRLGSTERGVQTVYSGDVFDTLQAVMAKDDTVRYRVYQLVVELSTISPEALEMSQRSGLLQKLVNEMHKDDILLQLNCLELLSDLARSNHGLTFLDTQGVVKKLEEMMSTAQSSSVGAFLLPGLMKFFGGLARFHPKEVLGHFQTFVGLVFASVCGHGEPSVRGLAMETVGFIGSTPEGKRALDKQGTAMTECVSGLGSVIRNAPSDIRIKAIETVASLLRLQVSDQTQELLQITEGWFNSLCPNPFDMMWSIAKQPFADLRLSALKVLESLAFLPWGQHLMNSTAGFKEYLLDRAIETTKESKEAKFQVVHVLTESPTMRDIFGEPYYVQLMEFFCQGPFFVRAQAEVAMEEA
ncbi:26S proteasome non-ATPase regulatory subunit 5-like [Babylonia areolata]|uniref:26S proteasome non-ATPase regulatory subunit 5-like n=1 Tax=Babylonia areolata TaxID=304850 RepID=UPI003FD67C5A